MRRALVIGVVPLLTACEGVQNALGGQGAEAQTFTNLFVLFVAVCTFMYLLVAAGLVLAVWRRRRPGGTRDVEAREHHQTSRAMQPALIAWVVLIVGGLAALTVASFFADRSNAAIARDPRLILTVTANQWWWDVKYETDDPSKTLRTANEIHLPVGVPAEIRLRSNDVIHSFWIPNLAGKQDLIPGRETDIQLLARKAGLYRGQCAEFCGIDHALMALDVTVESRADFQRWYAAQLAPAAAPAGGSGLAGYNYVTTRECSNCHAIAGTPAGGQVGPDLTHFASRRSIAAGTLPMNVRNIARWIGDPQAQKPGNHMPKLEMSQAEVRAVSDYLETLK